MQIRLNKTNSLIMALCLIIILISGGFYLETQNKHASSPEIVWQQLVTAMQHGDLERIQELTTDNGYASLQDGEIYFAKSMRRWQNWGDYYAKNGDEWLHWTHIDKNTQMAQCCGDIENRFIFIRTGAGWQLEDVQFGA